MVSIFAISGLINALISISFGLLVISKNWKERSNQLFFLMTLSLAFWGLGYWKWLISVDYIQAIFWVKVFSIASILIPVFFLHWVLITLNKSRRLGVLLTIAYSVSIFILFFISYPIFIESLDHKLYFNFWPTPGILYSIYFFTIYIGLVLASLFILILNYFKSKDIERRGQIRYIILGAIIGFGGGLSNFFLWYEIQIPPYGTFLVAIFPFLLAYSALKHHLFSLKTVATELLVFFISIVLLLEASLSKTKLEIILRGTFFLFVGALGYLLIRSVYKEVHQREEIERLAKELTTANVRLKELDKLKSEFVSIASHQLRSPLTAIKGYASLILDGSYGKITYGVHEAINKIFQSSQSLVVMVEDFLNISRIEQGKMKYDFVTSNLQELIEKVMGEQEPTVERAGLKINFSTDKRPPYLVSIDVNKIKQVITNLIDNSIKYTPKGSVSVRLYKEPARNKIIFSISDTGVGINKETIPQLFAKFGRASDANKVNVMGTGLGLYVVKEIINGHKGRVWVTSEGKGKGSSFFVELDENLEAVRVNRVNDFAKTV